MTKDELTDSMLDKYVGVRLLYRTLMVIDHMKDWNEGTEFRNSDAFAQMYKKHGGDVDDFRKQQDEK